MKTSPVPSMWFSWLRRGFDWIGGNKLFSRPKKTRKPRRCTLVVECLEERQLLNGAPLALDDGPFTVLHGQTLNNIAILANDSDPDNDPLSVQIQQYPSHGYAYYDPSTGTATYEPFLNYAGADSLTYKLWDGQAYSNLATVTFNVTNTPPVAVDDGPFSVLHGQTITGIDLKANDTDADGDETTVEIVAYPSHGYLYQDYYTGTWTYMAPSNYAGPDSLTYKLWDGQAYSNIATVTINVTNNAPVAADLGPYTVLQGQSVTGIDLLGSATDADGDALTVFIQQSPSHGYLYQDYYTGTWTYTADTYSTGPDSFTYKVWDGQAESNLATVTINVSPIPPEVFISSVPDNQATEGETDRATFMLTRTGNLDNPLTVNLTYGGTADAGWDFYFLDYGNDPPSTVTFAAGQSDLTLNFEAYEDEEVELTEQAIITIAPSGSGAYQVGTADSATISLINQSTFKVKAGDGQRPFGDPPPPLGVNPTNFSGTNFTVIIVMGSRGERIRWANSALATFPYEFVFNNVYNNFDLGNRLAQFPVGSISRLIIGGHGTYENRVGVQATNNNTIDPPGADLIDNFTLGQDLDLLAAIVGRLTPNAVVEFQSCGGNHPDRVDGNDSAAQLMANLLQRKIKFAIGDTHGWNDVNVTWEFREPLPPLVLSEPPREDANVSVLSEGQVEAVFAGLRSRFMGLWNSTTLQLNQIELAIVDLPGSLLGLTAGNAIWIDQDAAGHGWFVDWTPAEDSEFQVAWGGHELQALEGSQAFGKADLLTVLLHEIGHVLQLEHGPDHEVMAPTLPLGIRRLPEREFEQGPDPGRETFGPPLFLDSVSSSSHFGPSSSWPTGTPIIIPESIWPTSLLLPRIGPGSPGHASTGSWQPTFLNGENLVLVPRKARDVVFGEYGRRLLLHETPSGQDPLDDLLSSSKIFEHTKDYPGNE